MMRRKFFLLLLSCIVIFSCRNPNRKIIENAPYLSITITDGLNRKITFKENPKRIVSLAPNITEMFYALGAENSLIGISHACDYPPQTDKKKRFQTYPTLDYEGIIAEKPDCIITTTEVMSADIIGKFESYQIPVVFQTYKNLNDIYAGIEQIGLLTNREEITGHYTDSLRTLEKKIRTLTDGQIKYAVFFVVSVSPIYSVSKKSFINELIYIAGGKNISAHLEDAYPMLTREFVYANAPEIMVAAGDNPNYAAEMVSLYPEFYNMPCYQNKLLYAVEPDLILRAGPRTLQGLLNLTACLHPSLNFQSLIEKKPQ